MLVILYTYVYFYIHIILIALSECHWHFLNNSVRYAHGDFDERMFSYVYLDMYVHVKKVYDIFQYIFVLNRFIIFLEHLSRTQNVNRVSYLETKP